MNIELRDGFPLRRPDLVEERLQQGPVWRFFVIGDNRLLLLVLPLLPAVDFHLLNQLRIMIGHRDSQPLPAGGRLDPVAVLPFILLLLNRVEEDEDIGTVDFVKVTEPRKILGLMDGNDHFLSS